MFLVFCFLILTYHFSISHPLTCSSTTRYLMVIQYSICLTISQFIDYMLTLGCFPFTATINSILDKMLLTSLFLGRNFRSGIMGHKGRNFLRLLICIATCFPEKLFTFTGCVFDCLSFASSKQHL